MPRFPRAQRWERDPDFDDVVARLKSVRDQAAERLDLDPGVLCARDRLEAVARRRPASVEQLAEVPELRKWQIEELGEEFVRAVSQPGGATPTRKRVSIEADQSPGGTKGEL